ncbi:MAG: 30S ribosomal protein S20 [bacterium]
MANHKSAEKRIRSTKTRRTLNRYQAKTVRNSVKTIKEEENAAEAVKTLPQVVSQIDKLAKKGVIHKNKAANLKSKLMKKAKPIVNNEKRKAISE